ncbi:HAMP domain-containing sensor histidine kinase [Flavobacterium sp.]|uniref:sensor histidine kinase n=1 Tax=Flavobacterium sp. TaxID=239 RepID=UPI00262C6216|nr:HAMP domain-containing sensor histidine kinase [Flavobacterium sp.]
MFTFSFRNRIAFNYIMSTALLIAFVFIVIYQVIYYSVDNHINDDINDEVKKHLGEIEIDRNDTYLIQVDQWRAREHNTVDVNPVFVQFHDINNQLIDKSPNLKGILLKLYDKDKDNVLVDTYLNNKPIRQIQVPLVDDNKIIGHVIVAMSLDDATMILTNLKNILLIAFPLILVVLFLIARLIAGRSIKPVTSIIETSSTITRDNLSSRIQLPNNRDELYTLSETINNLLDRIENAIKREKQFTSDASHELRTPLAVIKGTMEVLIRKPREKQEYEEKINFCIREVDRLNNLVDQLLLLARFENQKQNIRNEQVYLNSLLLDTIARFSDKIKGKELHIKTNFNDDFYIKSDTYLVSIILSNILSNAIKYSNKNGQIDIELKKDKESVYCNISDNGIGIVAEDLEKIFNSFYRSDVSNHPEIKGTGLGLSIVKRLCDLLSIELSVTSEKSKGTSINLRIS